MRAHDLLQISGLADLVYVEWDLPEKRCPLWVERPLERAPFVVVRRANLFDGMIPVGVRGSSRQQRFAAYLAPKSIRNRITPEQLAANQGWLTNARTEEIPGFKALAGIEEKLANLPLAYGPTGSIGFELPSGLPTATSTSDLDLLIRAPERLPMQLAKKLIRSSLGVLVASMCNSRRLAVRYPWLNMPVAKRRCYYDKTMGPILVDDPWEFHHRDTENTEVGDRDRPKAGLSEVRCSVL
jgi:phosphoribosyl-dephospho-CoA transferase